MCYPILNLTEDQFFTGDLRENAEAEGLDWAIYRTASEVGLEDHVIPGELSTYPNSGYFLTFDALETSEEQYLEKLKGSEGAFFGNGARSVNLDFSVYSKTLNYWVYVQLLFEFSISDQVIFSKSFQQFRTDIYETPAEKVFKTLDTIRLACLISLALGYITEVIWDAC